MVQGRREPEDWEPDMSSFRGQGVLEGSSAPTFLATCFVVVLATRRLIISPTDPRHTPAHPVQNLSGMASATRIREGAHWAKREDCLKMVRQRYPAATP